MLVVKIKFSNFLHACLELQKLQIFAITSDHFILFTIGKIISLTHGLMGQVFSAFHTVGHGTVRTSVKL